MEPRLAQEKQTLPILARERAWVEIDLTALSHNIQQVQQCLSGGTELLAVIKADAYGHGAVRVAEVVLNQGATRLGVATVLEGIELRQAGIKAPILILGATHTPEQIQAIAHWHLQPTLVSPKQALIFSRTLQQTLPVHIKFDTGMSRLGVSWQEALDFIQLVHHLPNLHILSLYSHLATADSPDPTFMQEQRSRFEQVIQQMRAASIPVPQLHLANSAAAIRNPDYQYDLVRVGLALYGLYPASSLRHRCDLAPAMQVKARITQIKPIAPESGISYGHQFITQEPLRLAVVSIGYADGVPRILSNKMSVLVRGQRVRQLGAITMDQIMVDVSQIPNLQEGEVVTLIGRQAKQHICAEEWAEIAGTISWEILCGFRQRLPRITISGEETIH